MLRNELKSIKKGSNSKLEKKVINMLLNNSETDQEVKSYMIDVLYHGCISGMVGGLIYTADTVEFYNKYKNEINELLSETMDGIGVYNPNELFGDKWEKEDALATDMNNQNLLAWFGFEETTRQLADKLGLEY